MGSCRIGAEVVGVACERKPGVKLAAVETEMRALVKDPDVLRQALVVRRAIGLLRPNCQ